MLHFYLPCVFFHVPLLLHTWFKWPARHRAPLKPDNEPFVWCRWAGAGNRPKHAAQGELRTEWWDVLTFKFNDNFGADCSLVDPPAIPFFKNIFFIYLLLLLAWSQHTTSVIISSPPKKTIQYASLEDYRHVHIVIVISIFKSDFPFVCCNPQNCPEVTQKNARGFWSLTRDQRGFRRMGCVQYWVKERVRYS